MDGRQGVKGSGVVGVGDADVGACDDSSVCVGGLVYGGCNTAWCTRCALCRIPRPYIRQLSYGATNVRVEQVSMALIWRWHRREHMQWKPSFTAPSRKELRRLASQQRRRERTGEVCTTLQVDLYLVQSSGFSSFNERFPNYRRPALPCSYLIQEVVLCSFETWHVPFPGRRAQNLIPAGVTSVTRRPANRTPRGGSTSPCDVSNGTNASVVNQSSTHAKYDTASSSECQLLDAWHVW